MRKVIILIMIIKRTLTDLCRHSPSETTTFILFFTLRNRKHLSLNPNFGHITLCSNRHWLVEFTGKRQVG